MIVMAGDGPMFNSCNMPNTLNTSFKIQTYMNSMIQIYSHWKNWMAAEYVLTRTEGLKQYCKTQAPKIFSDR